MWVLLSGYPLDLSNIEDFKLMNDILHKFCHVELKVLSRQDHIIVIFLVEIDLRKGLSMELEINWRGFDHLQRLDY